MRAHHWEFGNMPKIEGVTPADVEQIIRYVRWLQREAGIYRICLIRLSPPPFSWCLFLTLPAPVPSFDNLRVRFVR